MNVHTYTFVGHWPTLLHVSLPTSLLIYYHFVEFRGVTLRGLNNTGGAASPDDKRGGITLVSTNTFIPSPVKMICMCLFDRAETGSILVHLKTAYLLVGGQIRAVDELNSSRTTLVTDLKPIERHNL